MSWARRTGALLAGLGVVLGLGAVARAGAEPPTAERISLTGKVQVVTPVITPLAAAQRVALRREDAAPFTLYHLPTGKPWSMVAAGDGSLWLTLEEPTGLLRLDPQHPTTATRYALPPQLHPYFLATGHGNTIWFTDFAYTQHPGIGHLVQVDPDRSELRQYAVPTLDAGPAVPRLAADGSVWFTEFVAGGFGRLNPGNGEVTEWQLPQTPTAQPLPFGITPMSGSTGVWLAESGTSQWDTFTLTGPAEGLLVRTPMPTGLWGPTVIEPAKGGLMISAHGSNDVLEVNSIAAPAQGVLIHPLHPPQVPGVSNPTGIVPSPLGTWVAEHVGNRLALLRADGNVVEWQEPQPATWAQWLQATGDGVWYAGYNTGTVGYLPFRAAPPVQVSSTGADRARQGGFRSIPWTVALAPGAPGPVSFVLHVDRTPHGVTATVTPNRVTLRPGEQAAVVAHLDIAGDADVGDSRLLLTADLAGQPVQVGQPHVLTVAAGLLGLPWGAWGVIGGLVLLAAAYGVRVVMLQRHR